MLNIIQTPTIKASEIKKKLNLDFFKDFEFGTCWDSAVYIFYCSDEEVNRVIEDLNYYNSTNNQYYYRLAQNHLALLNLLRAYSCNSRVLILTCE